MRFREIFDLIGFGVDVDVDGHIGIAVFEIAEVLLPFDDVAVEQIDRTVFEDDVAPNDDIVIIGDDQADLAEVISFLDVGPDDVGGLQIAPLADAGNMKEHDRVEQNVHEDDRSGEDGPMDGLDQVLEASRDIEQIKDDRGGENPDLE